MSSGRTSTGGLQGEAVLCPDGHEVPDGVRFCPSCGRYVGPPLDDDTWPAQDSARIVIRRRPSPWPGRLLAGIGVLAVGAFVVGLVSQGRGGSVLPADAPTTIPVTSAAPPPTAPPAEGQACAAPLVRNGGWWCEPAAAGPVWRPTPFAGAPDTVGLVGNWPEGSQVPSSALVRAGTVAVGAANVTPRTDGAAALWCVSVILQNRDTTPLRYGPEQFGLLDPAGNVVPVTNTSFEPAPLAGGELLPGGTATSYVCFPAPTTGSGGRYAIVYQPPGTLGRALLYVDR